MTPGLHTAQRYRKETKVGGQRCQEVGEEISTTSLCLLRKEGGSLLRPWEVFSVQTLAWALQVLPRRWERVKYCGNEVVSRGKLAFAPSIQAEEGLQAHCWLISHSDPDLPWRPFLAPGQHALDSAAVTWRYEPCFPSLLSLGAEIGITRRRRNLQPDIPDGACRGTDLFLLGSGHF